MHCRNKECGEVIVNKIIGLIICLSLAGCAVTTVTTPVEQEKPAEFVDSPAVHHTFPANETIEKLLPGISREEALALIGRSTTLGYELRQGTSDEYQAVTVQNPHKSQQFTKGNNIYQVDYYLVQINKADDNVADDELLPLVFESNRLIGKGWEFFNNKIKK